MPVTANRMVSTATSATPGPDHAQEQEADRDRSGAEHGHHDRRGLFGVQTESLKWPCERTQQQDQRMLEAARVRLRQGKRADVTRRIEIERQIVIIEILPPREAQSENDIKRQCGTAENRRQQQIGGPDIAAVGLPGAGNGAEGRFQYHWSARHISCFTTVASRDVNRFHMVSNSSDEMIPANPGDGIGAGLARLFARPAAATLVVTEFDAATDTRPPLCIDLDGTLVRTDTLMEGMIALLGGMRLGTMIGAMASGRAGLKARVAAQAPFDPALLPYNEALVDYIRAERAKGRRIVLATAANEAVADRVAAHLGLFDEVIASTATHNLKGAAKADALVQRFGASGFVYAGDAGADLAVWHHAAAAVLVNVTPGVAAKVRERGRWSMRSTTGRPAPRHCSAPCGRIVGQEPPGLRADLHRERDGGLAKLGGRHPRLRGVLRRRVIDLFVERSARPRRRPRPPA